MEPLSITNLQSGGFITNYYCSSACRHCLYKSSIRWPGSYCSPSKAVQIFQILHKAKCTRIHIGGGEPFVNTDTLISVLDLAKRYGIHIEYIETNASWFNRTENDMALLEKIRAFDISRLLISISPFHNEYIPFVKVKNLINACNECEITISGWMWDFFEDIDKFDNLKAHTLDEYVSEYGEEYLLRLAHQYALIPGGRALEFLSSIQRGIPLQRILAKNRAGCSELANTHHFHIDLFGNYVPGLCAGLSIRMEDLGKPLDRKNYPIINKLYYEGINGLLDYARDVYGFEARKSTYISKCELCYEIRSFFVNEEKILSHEIRPYEHYTL